MRWKGRLCRKKKKRASVCVVVFVGKLAVVSYLELLDNAGNAEDRGRLKGEHGVLPL